MTGFEPWTYGIFSLSHNHCPGKDSISMSNYSLKSQFAVCSRQSTRPTCCQSPPSQPLSTSWTTTSRTPRSSKTIRKLKRPKRANFWTSFSRLTWCKRPSSSWSRKVGQFARLVETGPKFKRHLVMGIYKTEHLSSFSLSKNVGHFLLAWPSQDFFLLPHIPWIWQGGSILLILYSMIERWPTILWFLWQLFILTTFTYIGHRDRSIHIESMILENI